ncbi:hypothetical protein BABINDRAFT_159354 [Babjeviella inositovora NRRL Y-12698]|uniref:Phosphatidic acid phosphatase type 2/haloperoxidase domain-containing protein n=1 Tax=Babjeviella inositovora NRRL Y-12698 TaxID=984486 RepID=A0A1E3R0E7_9ASCO|nr:uncharacterized protein BABINDRAFT_159354 [Babjeviella inositovora NRRL Y-12698]ODQ82857.1 hypothetical protein BABINDRAFT_159354 [Babjeviella inositovora NRRL Y-12698]
MTLPRALQKTVDLFDRFFLLEKPSPSLTIADLNLQFDPKLSIIKFKNYKFTIGEKIHYGFLLIVFAWVFFILPIPVIFRFLMSAALFTACVIPFTSQFFISALPIFAWLAFYFSSSKIPAEWRPRISVKFLPAMETILYGDNLSDVLASFTLSFLDVLAWLPYGFLHFTTPFVVAGLIFLFGPPTSLRSYGFAFGYMNLVGVFIQILFPAAPPWYKNLHGLEPANYSMDGSAGGLSRVDALFGVDMYTTTFKNSPLVFGAFPSLHSGCASMDALFMTWLFPRLAPIWWGYIGLLWWSTMYLTHHYFIDLMAGVCLSFLVFHYTRYTNLPVVDATKFCRWSYATVEWINYKEVDPLAYLGYGREDVEMQSMEASSSNPTLFEAPVFEMGSHIISRNNSSSVVLTAPAAISKVASSSVRSAHLLPIVDDEALVSRPETPSVFDEEDDSRMASSSSNTSLDEMFDSERASSSRAGAPSKR